MKTEGCKIFMGRKLGVQKKGVTKERKKEVVLDGSGRGVACLNCRHSFEHEGDNTKKRFCLPGAGISEVLEGIIGGGWVYLYSFACLSAETVEWESSCFATTLLHYAPTKVTSALMIFFICGCLF